MNKTEILNIVNEPSKHIQIVKIDGKDRIVYSSKFVELLELIPSMLTKDEVIAMFTELQLEIEEQCKIPNNCASAYDWNNGVYACYKVVQQKIDALKDN